MSPTERTLKHFKGLGMTCAIVERWNSYARIRQDLFNFVDIVALSEGAIFGIQATSGSNVSARIEKIRGLETHVDWLRAGGRILVVGWRKVGQRGKRKLWAPRIVELTADGEEVWSADPSDL